MPLNNKSRKIWVHVPSRALNPRWTGFTVKNLTNWAGSVCDSNTSFTILFWLHIMLVFFYWIVFFALDDPLIQVIYFLAAISFLCLLYLKIWMRINLCFFLTIFNPISFSTFNFVYHIDETSNDDGLAWSKIGICTNVPCRHLLEKM
jgi:hypothetical protein